MSYTDRARMAKEAMLQARASGKGRRASELRRAPSMSRSLVQRQPSMRPKPQEVESVTAQLVMVDTAADDRDEAEAVALQERSRDLAPSGVHSHPDTDRSLLTVLEEILDRMGPQTALQNPLPFATLMQMLQSHIRDLDKAYLRKLFDQCDTNQVRVDFV
jgi:hypothetical protein